MCLRRQAGLRIQRILGLLTWRIKRIANSACPRRVGSGEARASASSCGVENQLNARFSPLLQPMS